MFQYSRGPRLRADSSTNHALGRIRRNRQAKSEKACSFLTVRHLIACLDKIKATAGRAPGPDGLTFDSLSEGDWHRRLRFLAYQIKKGTYQPGPTRAVTIVESATKSRVIHVPNIIDRVASRACMEAMKDTVEVIFADWSYGYRPGRSHLDILNKIKADYGNGCHYACHYDARKAFDHVKVRKLRELTKELQLPVKVRNLVESVIYRGLKDDRHEEIIGVSQGDSLSGLLFNLYVDGIHDRKIHEDLGPLLHLYRYADDFIVVGNNETAVRTLVEKSRTFLTEEGLETNNAIPVNINNRPLDILGLTMESKDNKINFRLTDSSWNRLDRGLDKGLIHPEPSSHLTTITKGWLKAHTPVTWTEGYQSRLDALLSSYGIKPMEEEQDQHEIG